MRHLLPLLLLAGTFVLNGCASYSHTVIAKRHEDVAAKLQEHLLSNPREIRDLEQTVNRKVARFQFSEDQLRHKGYSNNTDVFALPTDNGQTRVLVRSVRWQHKIFWSETVRKPDLEAKWLDRIRGLFSSEDR